MPDGVVLWTRLAPEPLEGGGMPPAAVEVGWEVARDASFEAIQEGSGHCSARAWPQRSCRDRRTRARPRIFLSLPRRQRSESDRPYGDGSGSRRAGRSASFCASAGAASTSRATSRRIGISPPSNFDFVFHTGDYIYEGRAYRADNPTVVREHHGQEIYTLVDYRNRYAQYKGDSDLLAAHLSAPFIMSWDDHEVDNDYAGMSTRTTRRPRCFCSAAPPPIRPTSSTCRSVPRRCPTARGCSSIATWRSAA